ncbi:hypothetical protein ACFQU2_27070 [Siccirubricoccus deserti]
MHRRLLALGFAATLALPVLAQQAPVPAWQQSRSGSTNASPLAPHPPKLTATAAEQVPVAALRVPAGFKVELWASGAPARG